MNLFSRHTVVATLLAGIIAGLALAAAGLLALPAQAQPPAAAPAGCTGPTSAIWLNVKIDGVRNGKGLIAVTLYPDNSGKFLAKHGSIYVGRVAAQSGTVRTCIFVPKPGVYGVAVYHDENASQKFDRNGLGLPAEGYGFSNNPSTIGGLPSFRSVRLNVPKSGLTTQITMKYP